MLFLIVLLLGYALCVEEERVELASSKADTVAVISLFMILGLTFSVSLYGIKKLLEKDPKQITSGGHHTRGLIPRKQQSPYEVITF
ncbi:uncharacterized protein NEMAJ01_1007 [Nematocida major]|uniref:uncharacterized protein n=1 Tax=Nematocida major TaxID=1912982 RepID=UPI002008E0DD|nr:uncharacterized protein NEMAJ01_1007 [Nematocida major]KAH9386111.1 hypothetical protein NEMAJ01_1007 [Nematocida major]